MYVVFPSLYFVLSQTNYTCAKRDKDIDIIVDELVKNSHFTSVRLFWDDSTSITTVNPLKSLKLLTAALRWAEQASVMSLHLVAHNTRKVRKTRLIPLETSLKDKRKKAHIKIKEKATGETNVRILSLLKVIWWLKGKGNWSLCCLLVCPDFMIHVFPLLVLVLEEVCYL